MQMMLKRVWVGVVILMLMGELPTTVHIRYGINSSKETKTYMPHFEFNENPVFKELRLEDVADTKGNSDGKALIFPPVWLATNGNGAGPGPCPSPNPYPRCQHKAELPFSQQVDDEYVCCGQCQGSCFGTKTVTYYNIFCVSDNNVGGKECVVGQLAGSGQNVIYHSMRKHTVKDCTQCCPSVCNCTPFSVTDEYSGSISCWECDGTYLCCEVVEY